MGYDVTKIWWKSNENFAVIDSLMKEFLLQMISLFYDFIKFVFFLIKCKPMKQTENGFSQHMYRTGCTPIFVQFGQILVQKFHNHISCLFFNFQNKEMSHTELQIWITNKIFVFLQHSGLSILLGQLTMFLVFWSFKFIDKLEILCEGQSVSKSLIENYEFTQKQEGLMLLSF